MPALHIESASNGMPNLMERLNDIRPKPALYLAVRQVECLRTYSSDSNHAVDLFFELLDEFVARRAEKNS